MQRDIVYTERLKVVWGPLGVSETLFGVPVSSVVFIIILRGCLPFLLFFSPKGTVEFFQRLLDM